MEHLHAAPRISAHEDHRPCKTIIYFLLHEKCFIKIIMSDMHLFKHNLKIRLLY